MAKEIPAFLRAEIGNNATDPTQEARDGMLGRFAQMRPGTGACTPTHRHAPTLRCPSFDLAALATRGGCVPGQKFDDPL
jgi:hypothetical protein